MRRPLERHLGVQYPTRRLARAVDSVAPSVRQNALVQALEARTVIEVAQVRELMTQRVDERGLLEELPSAHIAQSQLDGSIVVTHAIAPPNARALGEQPPQRQAESLRKSSCVSLQKPEDDLFFAFLNGALAQTLAPGGVVGV